MGFCDARCFMKRSIVGFYETRYFLWDFVKHGVLWGFVKSGTVGFFLTFFLTCGFVRFCEA